MTHLGTDASGAGAGDYGVRLRRRWWVVVLGVLLGACAALAYTASQPTRYTSTTMVLVQATGVTAVTSATGTSRADVNMDTEATLVTSEQVAEAAKGILKTATSATDLLVDVEVTVPTNSQVLDIGYTDNTAKSAQAGAQAFGQAYLGYRAGEAKKVLDGSNATLQNYVNGQQAALKQVTDQIAALPANSAERTYAEAQRTVLSNNISTAAARLSALQATSPTPGQVITDAPLPSSPSSPNLPLNLVAGLVVGLLLGLALAILADRVDHRLRHPSDVARRVGLRVLAVLPTQGGEDEAAVFDRMRNALVGSGDAPARLVQVSDAGDRGAAGMVALRVAESLNRSAAGATLVVASPSSALAGWSAVADRDGLSEVLRGRAAVGDVLVQLSDTPGVRVLPAGRDPEALEALLQAAELPQVLRDLLGSSASVVVDTAGTGYSAGAQAVAAVSDVTVLVAERGVADDRLVLAAAQGAEQMGARVAGVVLADRTEPRSTNGSTGTGRAARRRGKSADRTSFPDAGGSDDPGHRPVTGEPDRVPAGLLRRHDRTAPPASIITPATPQA